MIITPQLMRACGSGADVNDAECLTGYDWYMRHRENITEHRLLPSIAYFQNLYDTNNLDEDVTPVMARKFLRWANSLKKNELAITLGGEYIERDQIKYMDFEDKEVYIFNGEDELKAHLKNKLNLINQNPFKYISASYLTESESFKEINTPDEYVSGKTFVIFDGYTGQYYRGTKEELQETYERVLAEYIHDIVNAKIQVSVIDTVENLKGWRDEDYVYTD